MKFKYKLHFKTYRYIRSNEFKSETTDLNIENLRFYFDEYIIIF